MGVDAHPDRDDPAALAGAVLDEEERRAAAQRGKDEVVLPDDLLPGVGADSMPIGRALRIGGPSMLVVLSLAVFVEQIERGGFAVLAPDIQESLDVSNAVIGAIGGAFGVLFLAGSIPISSLADRLQRTKIAAVSIGVWSVIVALNGFVVNAFQLFIGRLGSGLGQSYQLPVNGPLLLDTYPIEARGRIFATSFAVQSAGNGLAPFIAGAIAAAFSGPESWRWFFWLVAIAAIPIAVATALLREPRRGRHEMIAVLGHEVDDPTEELPISLAAAFERLRRIKTFYYFLVGMASIGLGLFSAPIFLNILYEDRFGLDAFERGLLGSLMTIPGLVLVVIVGRRADQLFRKSPPRTLIFIGLLVASFGVVLAIGVYMPNVVLLGVFVGLAQGLAYSAFAVVVAPIGSVIPYRLRSRGIAMIGVYTFVFGAFFGAVLTGLLSDAIGTQAALAVMVVPASTIGGALIAYGARYVRHDISRVVEELQEERDEVQRMTQLDEDVAVIQVRNLDFSYGKVQVLFGVDLDVARGETLALLGTNGAGKSTLLRVISGLGVPERGVVRFNGRTVTFSDPEIRVKIGIVQLVGGGAVFPPLSVDENLRMAGYLYTRREMDAKIDRAMQQFPMLAERRRTPAGDLSGGQQQMLALAMALVHEPEVLIIDELSLGLAPLVLQSVLEVVTDLKERGQTMIIVEQSLNVALTIADRAVFMEKGTVRFTGSAQELAARDDLARAVFLGE